MQCTCGSLECSTVDDCCQRSELLDLHNMKLHLPMVKNIRWL